MTRIGAIFSQADSGTDPERIRAWAVAAEAAGFDHILAYDHVLGASVDRLGPGPFGPFPAAPYTVEHTFHEILTLFSHLAAVTKRIGFVTSVLVLPQRQTAIVAKQVATVDLLSGGRLHVAVGAGWNAAEYEGLGADFDSRRDLLEEQIVVLRRLWTEPIVSFRGRFHRLDRVGITPLPPHPIPIYVGSGAADPVLRRVVRVADGWMPLLIPGLDRLSLRHGVTRLRQLCEEAGRDPATLPIHGRVYLGDGWRDRAAEAAELGFAAAVGRVQPPRRAGTVARRAPRCDRRRQGGGGGHRRWRVKHTYRPSTRQTEGGLDDRTSPQGALGRRAVALRPVAEPAAEARSAKPPCVTCTPSSRRSVCSATSGSPASSSSPPRARSATSNRQEFILLSDTLGVSTLVEFVTHGGTEGSTENTVLGPFYVPGSPVRGRGESMLVDADEGDRVVIRGTVTDDAGRPLAGATLDCWQNATAGFYAVQQPGVQSADNLRGIYTTDRPRALAARAAPDGHDLAVLDEDAGHEHALGEQAAAVAAQVEHDRPRRPCFSTRSTWRRRKPCAPELNPVRRTTPTLRPFLVTTRPSATGISMRSRLTRTVRLSPVPPDTTPRLTEVPEGPLMRATDTSLLSPAIERPSTSTIRSSLHDPRALSGEEPNTRRTRRPRAASSTFMPTPSNSPCTSSWKRLACSGVR